MKSFLYDEKEVATQIYNNGFTNGYDRREAGLLAKYFRHVLGYGDTRIKNKIIEFCSSDKLFNAVTEYPRIKNYIKKSKNNFVVKTSVYVTLEEINRALTIKNFDAQKVYLSLILIARRNGYSNVSIKDITEIKKIANINLTNLELQSNIFNILYNNKLIYPIVFEKDGNKTGYQKILNIEFEGSPEINIKNDRELFEFGKTYEKYCGGYLVYCEVCGKKMIRKSSSHKLCEEHVIEKERLRKRNARN